MAFERSGIQLILDTAQYNSNVARVIADANKVDKSFDEIIDSANAANRALDSISGSVDVDVTVDDSQIREAQRKADDLTQTEDIDVNADISDVNAAMDGIKNQLDTIRALATIDLVIQGAGLLGKPQDLPFVSSILDADEAVQKLEGTTGRVIPGAADLVNDLFTRAWGDSRQSIADVIAEAANLGIGMDDFEESVTTAFQVADTGIGDTTEILRTMDTLVKNKLAGSFTEAGNLIVTAFQNGGNRGQDLLDTLNEYGTTFSQLKISGPGAIALITNGMKAGIDNSDRIADAMRETGIRLREIGTDENIANAFTRLDELSSVDLSATLDAYNAGEISGDEFFTGFFDSLRQANESSPAEASQISAQLVGTISEDFGPEAIAQLSPAWDSTMGVLEGRAELASTTINDTLTTALTELARTIEQEVATTLDDTFDIQGVVDKVKAAVPQIAAAIREGASISEAVEVAFNLEGDPLQKVESMFTNIGISLMQAIQAVLSVLPGQGGNAATLGAEIARISEGQFAFDVKLADDGAGLQATIQTALNRGVDAANITATLQDNVEDMLARGDLSGAQTLIDQIKEQTTIPITFRGVEFGPGTTKEEIQARFPSLFDKEQVNAEIDKLFTFRDVDTTSLTENARILGEMYADEYAAAVAEGDYAAALPLAEELEMPPEVIAGIQAMIDMQTPLQEGIEATATANEDNNVRTTAAVSDTQRAVEDFTIETAAQFNQNITDTIQWANEVTPQFEKVGLSADAIAGKIASINAALTTMGETPVPNSATPLEPRAEGGSVRRGQTIIGGENGAELFTAPHAGSIINAQNTSALMNALSSIGIGGGNTYNNTNIVLNSSANVQNNAQADVYGTRLSRSIRGFA